MLFGLFKNKKNRPIKQEECHEIMPYDVVIATNFNDERKAIDELEYIVKH